MDESKLRCIVDAEGVNFPTKGQRVVIKWMTHVVSLSGVQLKLGASEGAEGTIVDVQAIAERSNPGKPVAVEFIVKTDTETKTIRRDFTHAALSTVFVVED